MPQAQDWFKKNAPQSSGRDWFAENAPEAVPLTLDRQPADAPSALDAGHHPETFDTRHPHARFPGMVRDFVVGAGKELAEQGIRGGALLRKIPGVNSLDALVTPIDVDTRPANAAQEAGATALNVAEYVAPGGSLAKLGTAAATKAAPVIGTSAAARLAPRMAVEGTAAAGTAALQGGDPLTTGGTAAALPIAVPAVARAAGAALQRAEPVLTRTAGRINANALRVSPQLAQRNPTIDIPLEAAKAGAVISPSGERALSSQIAGLKNQASQAVQQSAAQVRPSDAAGPARALLRERQALGPMAVDDVQIIEDEIARFVGPDVAIPAQQMQAIKQYLQDRLKFGAGGTLPARAEVQHALRAGIREALEAAVPDVAGANAQMSRLIPVRQAVRDALGRERRMDAVQGAKLAGSGTVGLLAGGLAGGPVGAGVGGMVAGMASRALDHPWARSQMARGLYRGGQHAAAAAPSVRRSLTDLAPAMFRAALLAALDEPEPIDNSGQPK